MTQPKRTIALVGNPNCGKTTLFNALTGLHHRVGNWAGVTVESKSGRCLEDPSIQIIDLPGVYSLQALSVDERITAQFVIEGRADAFVNIIDSTNLERSLLLTLQLLEQGVPMVVALNMTDMLAASGTVIDVQALERLLGVPCVSISAAHHQNLHQLVLRAASADKPSRRFVATGQTPAQRTDSRQRFVATHIAQIRTRGVSTSRAITDRIDRIVTNRWLAFPIFALVIWLMYYVAIQVVGGMTSAALGYLFDDILVSATARWLDSVGAPRLLGALASEGIVRGVGAVLCFVPQILTLFGCISFLEGCGYMSRVAFIMDRLFRHLGMSGKAFIPLIVGCGCSVTGIMCCRTLDTEQERRSVAMLTPWVPCSAKLPVFAMVASAFFGDNVWVAPSMYFVGIGMVLVGGVILHAVHRTHQPSVAFARDMPRYRVRRLANILIDLWHKTHAFVVRAGTFILAASVLVWLCVHLDLRLQMVAPADSIAAWLGHLIAPAFAPLGFGNWQSAVALITGMLAKESIVSTLGVLLAGQPLSTLMSPAAAYSFMVFVLLSSPCVAAISSTHRALGSRLGRTLVAVVFQTGVAYVVAMLLFLVGNLLTLA